MSEKPYENISIKEVSEKAGLTRQTFYHNFVSKDMVLVYKANQMFNELAKEAKMRQLDKIIDLLTLYFSYWLDRKEFLDLLIKNDLEYIITKNYPEFFRNKEFDSFMQLLTYEDNMGRYQKQYINSFIANAMTCVLCEWIKSGVKCTPKEMAQLILGMFTGDFIKMRSNESNAK